MQKTKSTRETVKQAREKAKDTSAVRSTAGDDHVSVI